MSGMTCREFVELVTSHLDGALPPRTEAAFVDHLGGCPGCARYFGQMTQVIRSLRGGAVGPV